MQEFYVPIDGWEAQYEISNHGNVRSIDRFTRHPRSVTGLVFRKGAPLKPQKNKATGYWQVNLVRNGYTKNNRVHMLVAKAFLPDCPGPIGIKKGHWTVDHKDGNKDNNRSDNLQWLPCEENSRKANCGKAKS